MGKDVVKEKYGNLFDMYKQITGEILWATYAHLSCCLLYNGRTLGDYNLQTTVEGLYALGEAKI